MMKGHNIQRICGGPRTELGWKQLQCSCGWESRREYAYNDYQFSNLREQESQHYADVRKELP